MKLAPCTLSLIFGLALAITSFGQQTLNLTLTHDGGEREYKLYVPAIYDTELQAPLVLCYHGFTSNNSILQAYSGFNAIADTAGFIVCYPQGLDDPNGIPHWNVGGFTEGSTIDDVGFTYTLVETISQNYNIDPNRIYATGMSNGGYMSYLLACQLSEVIAAIASVTGSMTPEIYEGCNPQHPTPVLQIHGDSDPVVPYDGADFSLSIPDVLDYWVTYNACDVIPEVIEVPDLTTLDFSTAQHRIHHNGDSDITTEHFKIFGGGHDWPGAWGNQDISASEEIWKFFLRYKKDELVNVEASISMDDFAVYPNPTSTQLFIKSSERISEYEILNTFGELVMGGSVSSELGIDVSFLSEGIYLLKVEDALRRFVVER